MKYFDHAATTPPHEEVIRTVAEVMAQHFGNASSLHRLGEDSGKLLARAREVCASALDVRPGELVFTSGGTESNNLAIVGSMRQFRHRGNHIVTTSIEHPSVYETCKYLESQGMEITYVQPDEHGSVKVEDILSAVRQDTVLVSVMHVNNETGAIQPVSDIGVSLKKMFPRVIFHVDGVQGFGKVPLSLKQSKVDLYSLSAHKFQGPKGIGLLYIREGLALSPLFHGGGQEGGRRSGTENIPYIVGMAKAMRLARDRQDSITQKLGKLKSMLEEGLSRIPGLILNSPPSGAPHIVHFSYPGMKAETMLHMLEEEGFFVSTRSACSSKKSEPSRVLLSMNRSLETALSGIRISLGPEHVVEDITGLIQAIEVAVGRLQILRGGK